MLSEWNAPKYRKSYRNKYGSHCFLIPNEYKYPVCSKGKFDCKGIRSAEYYINLRKKHPLYKNLKTKINRLKRKHCTKKLK
jgi:hypothetical protein